MAETVSYNPFLTDKLLDESKLLLIYAAKHGFEVSKEIISSIIAAQDDIANKSFTAQGERSFIEAYNSLAKLIQPVDLASLKAASEPLVKKPNKFHRLLGIADKTQPEFIMMFFRVTTILCLGLLLIMQMTWLYGNVIISEINIVSSNTTKNRAELLKLDLVKKVDEDSRYRKSVLNAEQEDYRYKYIASQIALKNWLRLIFLNHDSSAMKLIDNNKDRQIIEPLIYVQESQYLLKVLEQYILPLLYGLVGACAYIIRTLSQDIKNLTYAGDSNAAYFSRLLLGGLSGLAIGWFVEPESASTLSKLSPFAIAFIAGYSVELLFSVMDRVVAAFTPSTKNQ